MTGPLSRDDTEKLTAELERRIEATRDGLEHPQTEEWANLLRGRIQAYRDLLKWLDPVAANKPPEPLPEHMRISDPPDY